MSAVTPRHSVVLCGVLAACLLLAGCPSSRPVEPTNPGNGPTAHSGGPPPAARGGIKIGAVLPLTGDTASYGIAAQRGITQAVDELNGKGGVDGKPLQVVFEDDQGQAAKALEALKKLISVDKVPVVMGSAGSSVTLAMCPFANQNKVVLISPISSSQELTTKGGAFFFRVCPSDVVQAGMMAKWMQEDGRRKASVLYINTSWGQGLKDEFIKRFKELGGALGAVESCDEGVRDLRAQLTKIRASGSDALYGITHGREGGAMLRQAKELGLKLAIYGADVWGSPELAQTAGDAAKGAKIIVPAEFKSEGYYRFAQAFQAKFHSKPDTYAAYSYDMLMTVAGALKAGRTGEALRDALRASSTDGVTGPTRFDAHGDVVGKGFERKVL